MGAGWCVMEDASLFYFRLAGFCSLSLSLYFPLSTTPSLFSLSLSLSLSLSSQQVMNTAAVIAHCCWLLSGVFSESLSCPCDLWEVCVPGVSVRLGRKSGSAAQLPVVLCVCAAGAQSVLS